MSMRVVTAWVAPVAPGLHHSLQSLNHSLGGKLRLFRGDATEIIGQLVNQAGTSAVYWNRCYEPWRIRRDATIKQLLLDQGVDCRSFNGSLLWEPWEVAKQDGNPYRVFTPFYQKARRDAPTPRPPLNAPQSLQLFDEDIATAVTLESLALLARNSGLA